MGPSRLSWATLPTWLCSDSATTASVERSRPRSDVSPTCKSWDSTGTSWTGAIPPELGNLAKLRTLWLHENELGGAIPPELGNLVNLETLWLHDNRLSGAIPAELGNLSQLVLLWLRENQLSGTIPPTLGDLSKLDALLLNGNALQGAIPPELGRLAELRTLHLEDNQLSGVDPAGAAQPLLSGITDARRQQPTHGVYPGRVGRRTAQ